MAESISNIELIARAIKTQLETVDDVSSVVRPTKSGVFNPSDRLIVIEQNTDAEDEETSVSGNKPGVGAIGSFTITGLIEVSDKDTTPVDTRLNAFASAIRAAMMDDTQWGGIAINTFWRSNENIILPGRPFEGVECHYDILHREVENDPSTRR